jgi:anti-sigma B factor antagonist
MEITLGMSGEIPVFSLSGRLDAITSPILEERLKPLLDDPAGAKHLILILDGAGLSYVSSAGLRVFLMAQRQLAARGGGLAFAGLTNQVQELFQLAGLQELFVIEATVDAAAAHLS